MLLIYFLRRFVSARTIPANANPAVAIEASTFVDTPVFTEFVFSVVCTESVLVSSFFLQKVFAYSV